MRKIPPLIFLTPQVKAGRCRRNWSFARTLSLRWNDETRGLKAVLRLPWRDTSGGKVYSFQGNGKAWVSVLSYLWRWWNKSLSEVCRRVRTGVQVAVAPGQATSLWRCFLCFWRQFFLVGVSHSFVEHTYLAIFYFFHLHVDRLARPHVCYSLALCSFVVSA